ncbi:alanine racemase [Eggerthia catenaformis OT 569 = DSM 20559]|uniref:Alanine racemase n=1 Tax=Eggerthia catenaformis OT 569 = DSM 20559 TaxID=999415 RepID=M2PZD7_9FIRM|nr:alanine racemase [Eggerthia catenaformis]EMD16035.1 alanine racemase [Eggerthia catenaformis OT 569 = DSM 20559]OUC50752.1 alanine racemase [Eggerthia catenaformis]
MTRYRDTYAKINLNDICYNADVIYQKTKKPMAAIIKANAYGHGYQEVANALKNHPHIALFAVATLKEAIDIRELGIKQEILVLGPVPLADLSIAIKKNISLTLLSFDYLNEIVRHHQGNIPVKVHIAIDTGMNRIGFKTREELEKILRTIDPKVIDVEGIFTHFATADEPSMKNEYKKQLSRFKEIIGNLKFRYIHCDNTAAMMFHDSNFGNLVRLGIGLYGIDPRGVENKELRQAMSLYTKVAMVKTIHKGEKVGYGMTYEATDDELIGTLPIGYADGFLRGNQNRHVYINGKEYPVVGRVCMDQCMVKVDETVHTGDDVEIFGQHISLARMANELGTIPYEITCIISPRVEREYED